MEIVKRQLCKNHYWTSMARSLNPILTRYPLTSSRWSPCSMINPSFTVPPHAKVLLSSLTILGMSLCFGLMPSIIVLVFEKRLVSRRTTIRVSSLSNSPQAHKSSGRPHFLHITAIYIYHIYQNPLIKPSLKFKKETSHNLLYDAYLKPYLKP